MRTLLGILFLSTCTVSGGRVLAAKSIAGFQLSPAENACAQCHNDPDVWETDQLRLFIPPEDLAEDVHFRAGVNCHDCHGGAPRTLNVREAHATDVEETESVVAPFVFPLGQVQRSCARCHEDQQLGVADGVHAAAGWESGAPLACSACHDEKAHGMLPVDDGRFINHQVQVCGKCHQGSLDTYNGGVHGLSLEQSGLLVTAVCASCHGAHGIYPVDEEQSTLHPANVAATCAKCHRFIQERFLQSVHGGGGGPGTGTEEVTSEAEPQRKPTCTDCHTKHDPLPPESDTFRLELPDRCNVCHERQSSRYALSTHGSLSALGYGPAANCSDCHGAHDVPPASDPNSKLAAGHLAQMCGQCHPNAPPSFLDFDPHADRRDPERDPVVYWVYVVLMTFLISTFSFFGLHSLLWFIRSLIHVARHGRPKSLVPGSTAYVRFRPSHRVAHTVMVLSFLGLALTGLPLKYSHYPWARTVADLLGGFDSTSVAHRIFGVVNIACLVVYAVRMLGRLVIGSRDGTSRLGMMFGPDSTLPNLRDLRDFFKMVRWFFGRGPKPTFERWTYWEKFDFWGACADIVIIGATGLILWFPGWFCTFLPGRALNVAKVIHSTQALLATGFVFAIHFFSTHLRPEKFPMDMSVLTGLVSEEELQEERPEYLDRMRRSGKLDRLRATAPPCDVFWVVVLGGFVALLLGLSLLAGILLGVLGG
ncbi:MAG TPA: cytochrome b/b6 domain-containing protein [Thermoguttaceae bacterium]|nr:cytochrome b/b6 domain-containing protein [Thermoguttaceae bacterium]